MIMRVIASFYIVIILTGCINYYPRPVGNSSISLLTKLEFPEKIKDYTFTNKVLLVEDGLNLYAFSLDEFKLLWEKEIEGNAKFEGSGIQVFDNQIIVTSNYKIITLDLEGNMIQEFDVSDKDAGPPMVSSVSKDVILVTRPYSWNIEAYDRKNGNNIWKKSLGRGGGDVYYNNKTDRFFLMTTRFFSVVGSHGSIFFEENIDKGYYWFNAYDNTDTIIYQKIIKDGNQICSFSIALLKEYWCINAPFEVSSVYISNDKFFVTLDEAIQAYSLETGDLIWNQETEPVDPPLLLLNENIYVRDQTSSFLYVFDLNTGRGSGAFPLPTLKTNFYPLAVKGKEILTNGEFLFFPLANTLYIYE
jgi:outer membrane protein assembly factor BamB